MTKKRRYDSGVVDDVSRGYALLKNVPNPEECDAIDDDSSAAAQYLKIVFVKKQSI